MIVFIFNRNPTVIGGIRLSSINSALRFAWILKAPPSRSCRSVRGQKNSWRDRPPPRIAPPTSTGGQSQSGLSAAASVCGARVRGQGCNGCCSELKYSQTRTREVAETGKPKQTQARGEVYDSTERRETRERGRRDALKKSNRPQHAEMAEHHAASDGKHKASTNSGGSVHGNSRPGAAGGGGGKGGLSGGLTQPAGWQSLLSFSILFLACLAGFSSRLFAVIRFESIIHEFDPW